MLRPDDPVSLYKSLIGWDDFLGLPLSDPEVGLIRRHERTGRPLGSKDFVRGLESILGRRLLPKRTGPKKKKG